MSAATDRAKKCRAHAEQCRDWSEVAHSQTTKQEFLKVAAQWESLAREIEDIERMRVFTMTAGDERRLHRFGELICLTGNFEVLLPPFGERDAESSFNQPFLA